MPDEIDYSRTAWGDESVRMHTDPPMYLLGATVLSERNDAAMKALELLKPHGAKKLHWRELGAKSQQKALAIISGLDSTTTIISGTPLEKHKQERARRKCLELLLTTLEGLGIDKLILESREADLDKKDVDLLFYARQNMMISNIDIAHVPGFGEPRLYVPDQILGAFGDVQASEVTARRWIQDWEKVKETITEISVSVR